MLSAIRRIGAESTIGPRPSAHEDCNARGHEALVPGPPRRLWHDDTLLRRGHLRQRREGRGCPGGAVLYDCRDALYELDEGGHRKFYRNRARRASARPHLGKNWKRRTTQGDRLRERREAKRGSRGALLPATRAWLLRRGRRVEATRSRSRAREGERREASWWARRFGKALRFRFVHPKQRRFVWLEVQGSALVRAEGKLGDEAQAVPTKQSLAARARRSARARQGDRRSPRLWATTSTPSENAEPSAAGGNSSNPTNRGLDTTYRSLDTTYRSLDTTYRSLDTTYRSLDDDESKSRHDVSRSRPDRSRPRHDRSKPRPDGSKSRHDESKPQHDESKSRHDRASKPRHDESKSRPDVSTGSRPDHASRPDTDESDEKRRRLEASTEHFAARAHARRRRIDREISEERRKKERTGRSGRNEGKRREGERILLGRERELFSCHKILLFPSQPS